MKKVLKSKEDGTSYKVVRGDTLESIALAKCPNFDWTIVAMLNWGTKVPREVMRALCETVGVEVSELSADPAIDPAKIRLAPHSELSSPKILIPELWDKTGFAVEKTHKITVKRNLPVTAVAIEKLDKWFIPELEECELKYGLEGDWTHADQTEMTIYANNYCDCTAFNKGKGTFSDPAALLDEPVFRDAIAGAAPRKADTEKWNGKTTTDQGYLGRKPVGATDRFVNVAFSPYLAQLRYWKEAGDKDARIVLQPFWVCFDEKVSTPGATLKIDVTPATVSWKNDALQDHGAIEVTDRLGQRVYHEVIGPNDLKAGEKTMSWDKSYMSGVLNGRFASKVLRDDIAPYTATKRKNELVFRSTPYKAKVTTVKFTPAKKSMKIEWEVKKSNGKLKQGQLRIIDGKDKLIQLVPLTSAKLKDGTQSWQWDGKYAEALTNSKGGDEAIPEDMPYRVVLEAHTPMNEVNGLALAVAHSEVRLYTHKMTCRPDDARFEMSKLEPSMSLRPGLETPGAPPVRPSPDWYRQQLMLAGFHPGPIRSAGPEGQNAYRIALREFKRSVPADGNAGAGNFTRLDLSGGNDLAENGATETAITSLRPGDRRSLYCDVAGVRGDSEAPDVDAAEFANRLKDKTQEIGVWVDDRQYYTTADAAMDETNSSYLSGSATRDTLGLMNYRGDMVQADAKTDLDKDALIRPWVPLRAEPSLLSRTEDFNDPPDAAKSHLPDGAKRDAVRRAIGPLRIDWTVRDLPMEVVDIDPADYPGANEVRSRKYVGWAIYNECRTHEYKDTKRKELLWNAKIKYGGARAESGKDQHAGLFGTGDDGLDPWWVESDATTELVSTVVHDFMLTGQAVNTEYCADQVGGAGVYFRPSTMAGDGYRVGARISFKKYGDYKFPNLDALAARYPAAPEVQGPKMRVWRRTSFRAYSCWGAATGKWPANVVGVRRIHRAAHVYWVHEGGVANTVQINTIFDPGNPAHQTRYKNVIKNNRRAGAAYDFHVDTAKMSVRAADMWPWGHRDDLGWPSPMPAGFDPNDYGDWFYDSPPHPIEVWRAFRTGLILAVTKRAEELGYMRGHLMVDFTSSPGVSIGRYECNGANTHEYQYHQLAGAYHMDNQDCPAPGCKQPAPNAALVGKLDAKDETAVPGDTMPQPAVGTALGSAWLFDGDENLWAHELGHHRQFEHAADAPGDKPLLHDSQANKAIVLPVLPDDAGLSPAKLAKRKNWDRRCTMSYYSGGQYFCGKCLLRHRGWKVTAITGPGTKSIEPA